MKLPHNHDLERDLLACLLQHPDTGEVIEMATSGKGDLFDLPAHRQLFGQILKVAEEGRNPDEIAFGGKSATATELFSRSPLLPYQYPAGIKELSALSIRRDAVLGAYRIIEVAGEGEPGDAVQAADELSRRLATSWAGESTPPTTAEQIHRAVLEVQNASKGTTPGKVQYQIDWMDTAATHYRGQVHCIGAYPGKGKTTLALQAFVHQAYQGTRVAYFVLESDAIEMVKRILAYRSGLPVQALLDGIQSNRGLEKFANSASELHNARRQMFLRGPSEWDGTIEGIDSACRRITRDSGPLDMVYLDYLQDCKTPKSAGCKTQFEEVGYNAKRFKRMCGDLDVAGVMLSQFSREASRERKKPAMKDFRGSGEIEHCCHLMSCLHRDGEDSQSENCERMETWWYSVKTRLVKHWNRRVWFEGGMGRYVSDLR